MDIITAPELVSYLQLSGVTVDEADLALAVSLTNGLVSEAWAGMPDDPEASIPFTVKTLALEVAARPWRNPKGLASWTRSVDDASRTERLPDAVARAGIYLTEYERTQLEGGGTVVGEIHLGIPGYTSSAVPGLPILPGYYC